MRKNQYLCIKKTNKNGSRRGFITHVVNHHSFRHQLYNTKKLPCAHCQTILFWRYESSDMGC